MKGRSSCNDVNNVGEVLNEYGSNKTSLIDVCTGMDNEIESDINCINGNRSHLVLKIKSNHKFAVQQHKVECNKNNIQSSKRMLNGQQYHKQSNSMRLPICNNYDGHKLNNCSLKIYQYNNRNDVLSGIKKMKSYSVSNKDKANGSVVKGEKYSRNGIGVYKQKKKAMTFSIVDIPFNGKNERNVKERIFCGKYLKGVTSHIKGRNIINLQMKKLNGFNEIGKCLGNTMKNTKSLPQIKFKFERGIAN